MDIIKHANKIHDMDHKFILWKFGINIRSLFKHKMKNNNKFASDCIWEVELKKSKVIFALNYIVSA